MDEIDYLVIGHVTRDLSPAGDSLGGTVTFCSLTARDLGLRVGIVTSAPSGTYPLLSPLNGIHCRIVPSKEFTTFENSYTPAGRAQTLHARAENLVFDHVPLAWQTAPIVHLAPVADEIDPALAEAFNHTLVGITPQGWMRRWDAAGRIVYRPWQSAPEILPYASAVVLSIEDIQGDEALVAEFAHQVSIVVVTRGADGCTLFVDGDPTSISAPAVPVADPTGAGDIFAAAFFVRLSQTGEPAHAARFATRLASASVTQVGLKSTPDAASIREALKIE